MRTRAQQQNRHNGFTLIELMVALALFMIVLIIAMGGLLQMLDTNRKVQSLQVVMNGFNYTLESMTRDIRFGENYTCNRVIFGTGSNCLEGGDEMAVRFVELDGTVKNIAYRLSDDRIERCNKDTDDGVCEGSEADDWIAITSQLITVENLTFYVTGAVDPGKQGRVTMIISGFAEVEGDRSDFTLQTTVSQREFRN